MEHAKIQFRPDLPTDRVIAGTTLLHGSPPFIKIANTNDQDRARPAIFPVEVQETSNSLFSDLPQGTIRINENLISLFGITKDRNESLQVSPAESLASVPKCTAAEITVEGGSPEVLERYLRENHGLIHPIREQVEIGEAEVSFEVEWANPSLRDRATVRVTDETELDITSGSFSRNAGARSSSNQSAGASGSGQSGKSDSSAEQGSETGSGGEGEDEYILDATVPGHGFDAVAGFEEIKKRILSKIALVTDDSLVNQVEQRYNDNFVKRGNTMLLYGPPGCGKTFLAEAIAKEFKDRMEHSTSKHVTYFDVKATRILSKYKGESEEQVEKIFQQVRDAATDGYAVIFFDEVETLITDRTADDVQSHQKSVTNQFLREMNEVTDDVLLIGATNMPFTIDSAAARRFHTKLFVGHPGSDVMAEVWRGELEGVDNYDQIDFEDLGEASVEYTPAEISDRVIGSKVQSEVLQGMITDDPVELNTKYLQNALEDTPPRTVNEYVEKLRPQVVRNEIEGYSDLEEYVKNQLDTDNDE